jgi:hypothetical protein
VSEPELAFRRGVPYGNDRWYRNPFDGSEVPSITTVTKAAANFAIQTWAPKEAAECAVLEQNKWSGMSDAEAIDYIKNAPNRKKDSAADRGTRTHEILEAVVKNTPHVDVLGGEDIAGYVAAGRAWLEDFNPKIIACEFTVFGPGYSGTGDLLIESPVVIPGEDEAEYWDFKTSKGIYGSFALQTNAVAYAPYRVEKNANGEWHKIPMPKIKRGGAVWLKPDGTYEAVPLAVCDEAYNAFLSCIPLYHFLKREAVFMEKPLPKPGRTLDQEVYDWLYARASALPKGALMELAERWPAGVPTFKQHRTGEAQMVDRHLEAIMFVLDTISIERDLDYPEHPHMAEGIKALTEGLPATEYIDIGTTKVDRERILLAAFGDRETAFAAVKAAAKRIGAKTPRSFNGCLDIHEAVAEALLTQTQNTETPA